MTLPIVLRYAPKILQPLSALLTFCLLAVGFAVTVDAETKPLTNVDVIKMLENKIPESVILSKIQTSEGKFDTSTDAIIELSKKGVGEKVLNAMLNQNGGSGDGAKSGTIKSPDVSVSPTTTTAGDKPNTLSYGTAGLVKKGVTTQLEIMELFGGPDVMTTDKEGTEVWMYDKTTSTVSGSSKQSGKQARQSEVKAMATYFGLPLVFGVGGAKSSEKGQSEQEGQSENTRTSSITTFTFIIKFNTDKTVKDYSVRQAKF